MLYSAMAVGVRGWTSTRQSKIENEPLTPRETEVYALLLSPLSRKEIARKLGINRLTVRAHCTSIYEKYGVHSRAELCACVPVAIDVELTARQAQMLRGLLAGLPLKLIARSLGIATKTAKHHAGLLYRALGVDGRQQLAARYRATPSRASRSRPSVDGATGSRRTVYRLPVRRRRSPFT